MSEKSVGEKMAALWGRELRPVSAQLLDGLTLSDAERRLLTEYGLPTFWGGPLGDDVEAMLLEGHDFLMGFAVRRRQGGAVTVSKYPEITVNTNLARFAACLVLHRILLAEGAAPARRLYSGDDILSEPRRAEYRAAMVILMDDTEREMREADPETWQSIIGEYDEYAMWDAEGVYARWEGTEEWLT